MALTCSSCHARCFPLLCRSRSCNHDGTWIVNQLEDERHLLDMLVVLITSAGTPSIYVSDEQVVLKENGVRPTFRNLKANFQSTNEIAPSRGTKEKAARRRLAMQ